VAERPVWLTVAGAIPPIGAKHILFDTVANCFDTVCHCSTTVLSLFSTIGHSFVLARPPLLIGVATVRVDTILMLVAVTRVEEVLPSISKSSCLEAKEEGGFIRGNHRI
jgi:hypothetical protein